ncbi:MAG: hypothetical protein Q9187_008042, partial [Circinaria calcarea]
SRNAYERGDREAAHQFSEEGKRHGQMMEQYNKQASDFIFRENNAVGRVDGDTIDLHGQFVEEAEDILEARINIVGKGNHSVNHIQKIKPRVEQICRELHLQYATEENAGRIYINLTGGPAQMPQHSGSHGGGHQQHQGQGQHHGQQQHGGYQGPQPGYGGQQQYGGQYQQHQQPHDQNAEIEAAVKKYLPRLLRKLERACCVVM